MDREFARAQGHDFEPEVTHSKALAVARSGQLARAGSLARRAETPQAPELHTDFLTLWKQADANVPILKQAQVEAAKLR